MEVEEALDKHTFMLETFSNTGIDESLLTMIKYIYFTPKSNN
jgi:hypothetical protein